MDISVIIVNFNTTDHLEKCLDSVFNNTSNVEYEIIVVDNNSDEREIETFQSKYRSVAFYFRESNDGFGAGCNFGAEKAKGKYLLFLNPDVIVSSNVLHEIYSSMEKDPGIGVESPVYLEDNGEIGYSYNYFPGIIWEWYEGFGFGASRRIRKLAEVDEIRNETPFEVDWVMGSFIFTPAEVFRKVNGFDEKIFLYYEDVDLQYKIKKNGRKIICRSDLKIKHFKRSSVRSYFGENLYYFHMARSNLIYMYKHFGFLKRNLARSFHVLGILFRMVLLPFRFKFRNKKLQKYEQYWFVLHLYLKSEKNVYASKLVDTLQQRRIKSIQTPSDTFWNG